MRHIRIPIALLVIASAAGAALSLAAKPPADPVQFSCRAAGQTFSSTSFPLIRVARGSSEFVMSPKDDLLSHVRTEPDGEKSWSSQPVAGSRQQIDDIRPEEPITLIITLGAPIPNDPAKFMHVTLAVKGVSKSGLAKLPLSLPIAGRGKGTGAHAGLQVQYAGGFYEGIGGEVVIEAVDFKSRTAKGRFQADAKQPGFGAAPVGPAIKLEDGVFSLLPRK